MEEGALYFTEKLSLKIATACHGRVVFLARRYDTFSIQNNMFRDMLLLPDNIYKKTFFRYRYFGSNMSCGVLFSC